MTIAQLRPRDRFALACNPNRTGEVVRIGVGSAVVRYDGLNHRRVDVRRGDEVIASAEFDAPNKPVTISLGTQVERLPGASCRACGREEPACEL